MNLLLIASIILLGFVICYGAVVVAMYFRQRNLLYHFSSNRPTLEAHDLPRMCETILQTSDGLDLLAWFAPAAHPDGPFIVYFHGNAGSLDHRAEKLRPFLDAGFGILAVSWRGFGGNPGKPTEEGLYRDADAAIAMLQRDGFASSHMILYGESLGTAVATRCAVEYPVSALVLEAPPLSIVKVGQWRYPWLPVKWLAKDRFETERQIHLVRCPIMIIHGRNDTVVPFEMGQTLSTLANGQTEFRPFDDAHHTNLHEHGSSDHVISFLTTHGLRPRL